MGVRDVTSIALSRYNAGCVATTVAKGCIYCSKITIGKYEI